MYAAEMESRPSVRVWQSLGSFPAPRCQEHADRQLDLLVSGLCRHTGLRPSESRLALADQQGDWIHVKQEDEWMIRSCPRTAIPR